MNNKTKKDFIKSYTDNYFLKSKEIIKKYDTDDYIVSIIFDNKVEYTLHVNSLEF